jgi:hypothetical protein
VLRPVKGTVKPLRPREKSTNKYDLTATPCFGLANDNDWFRWFGIITLPPICSHGFSFMGGVGER